MQPKTILQTLIEVYEAEELPALLKLASDAQLKDWESLLKNEHDRLHALNAVCDALMSLRSEQKKRAGN